MSQALFRAIIGPIVPIKRDDDVALPYRRTFVPPAPKVRGLPSKPREGESPIMEYPEITNPPT